MIKATETGRGLKLEFDPPYTLAEPIYPDLIDITIEPEAYSEIVRNIDEEDRLKNEKPGASYVLTVQEAIQRGIQVGKLSFSKKDYQERERTFDPSSRRYATKPINVGKPINNNDPFPVDEKIQEIEEHLPRVKIQESYPDPMTPGVVDAYRDLMILSEKVERRLTKIENNLSTVMRNLFRAASRMSINCVYYGGQNEYRKYATIRCLHHDRGADGQMMTLDQCLNCTRYEPIAGKVYDILDDTGKSLPLILDDNQMAYKSMKEYLDATRTERYQDPAKKAKLDPENLEERDESEKDFKGLWSEGFKMDWDLTPVEAQTPHVIYEDQAEMKTLSSSYRNITYEYQSTGYYGDLEEDWATANFIQRHQKIFDQITDAKLLSYINNGKTYAQNNTDSALKRMAQSGYESYLNESCKKEGVDPLLMLSLIIVESTGQVEHPGDHGTYIGLTQIDRAKLPRGYFSMPELEKARINIDLGIKHYKSKLRTIWNTQNPLLGLTGYNSGEGMIMGVSGAGVLPVDNPGLNRDHKETWTWLQIAPNLERNVRKFYGERSVIEKLSYYPRIHHVYQILLEKKGYNPLSGNTGLTFPYTPKTIKSGKIYFLSDYGARKHEDTDEVAFHFGLDLHAGKGTEVCAAADGEVFSINWFPNGAGRVVTIDHGSNLYTLYMHLEKDSPSKYKILKGDKVKRGQVIGEEGSSGVLVGQSSQYASHLHFEVRMGKNHTENAVDPKEDVFPWLKGVKPSLTSPITIPL